MSTNDDWEELVERHLRDELTEPEREQLAERLDSDPAARQAFVEEALWDTRMAEVDDKGHFQEVYDLNHFTVDPAVLDRRDELASRPDELVLTGVWAFTHTGDPSGLEVFEIELTTPIRDVN